MPWSFQPIDFTLMKNRTRVFLTDLLVCALMDTQHTSPALAPTIMPTTRDRGAIEGVFIKATKVQTLAMGLVYFLTSISRETNYGEMPYLKWAIGVAKDTLQTGLEIVPKL
jgi:nucleolar MIF4G domain-containing protein 1